MVPKLFNPPSFTAGKSGSGGLYFSFRGITDIIKIVLFIVASRFAITSREESPGSIGNDSC